MRHYATHTDAGPVLALHYSGLGQDVVVCEFLTIEAAQREADRLNREARAMAAMAVHHYRPATAPRRSVRSFQNEDIHG